MPLLALACLGDRQGPSPKCRALQLGNGRTGLGGVHHRDEGKAAGAAGLPLRHKVDVLHRSIRFEELAQLFSVGRVPLIADKNLPGAFRLASALLRRQGGGCPAVSSPGQRHTTDAEEHPQIEQYRVDRGRGGGVLLPESTLHPLPPGAPPGIVRVDAHAQRSNGEDEYHDPTHRQPLADGGWPHRAFLAVSRPTYHPVVTRRRSPSRAIAFIARASAVSRTARGLLKYHTCEAA